MIIKCDESKKEIIVLRNAKLKFLAGELWTLASGKKIHDALLVFASKWSCTNLTKWFQGETQRAVEKIG